jgi:hypothetical protein
VRRRAGQGVGAGDHPELESAAELDLSHDSSTSALIRRYWALKG